jgi:hypothetical protein
MIFGGTLSQLLDFSLMTVIYKEVINKDDIENLQIDLERLREWAAESVMKINRCTCKAVFFTRTWLKDPLNCKLGDQ